MKGNTDLFAFSLPVKVEFGPGAIESLPPELARNGFEKAVFVVTPGRHRSGMLDRPINELHQRGIQAEVYPGVRENPDVQSVARCVAFLEAYRPEVIIGLGGGSSLDTAKAAGTCYANGVEDIRALAALQEKRKSLPAIMVPTTSGSGSEVNYWAVVTDEAANEKLSVGDPAMAPLLAVVDPALCVSLPPGATLYTGIDALTHAVESFLSSDSNWLSDKLSLGAVSLIVSSIERAVADGRNLRARADMALASMLAGMSMENVGLGLIHALSHQVSGHYDTPHGLANALLLPTVLAFNHSACRGKMKFLDALVRGGIGFRGWLRRLYRRHGIDRDAVTIHRRDVPRMAEKALANVNARTNPADMEQGDIEHLLQGSFDVSDQTENGN
jgi:alcohol dehydrogenase